MDQLTSGLFSEFYKDSRKNIVESQGSYSKDQKSHLGHFLRWFPPSLDSWPSIPGVWDSQLETLLKILMFHCQSQQFVELVRGMAQVSVFLALSSLFQHAARGEIPDFEQPAFLYKGTTPSPECIPHLDSMFSYPYTESLGSSSFWALHLLQNGPPVFIFQFYERHPLPAPCWVTTVTGRRTDISLDFFSIWWNRHATNWIIFRGNKSSIS